MRRRALLASAALLTTTGCLGRLRHELSGPVRFGHARGRIHDASQQFVDGGLGGTDRPDDSYAASLFPSPPDSDVSVFTDALGTETQRAWDNEVHNENYEDGFVLLAQVRASRERAVRLRPGPLPCDSQWMDWRRARVPLGIEPATLDGDELADAAEVVATTLVYLEADGTPDAAVVPFLSSSADACADANATLTARPWEATV